MTTTKKQMTPAQLAEDMQKNPEKYIGKRLLTNDNRVGVIVDITEKGPVVRVVEN